MSQTNSALMSIITQYTKQFVDRISELENENRQLKQRADTIPSTLKADFDRLSERHTELKTSYAEIERENTKLRQDMEQLIAQQKSLESDIAQFFTQTFSTISSPPVQTPKKSRDVETPQAAPSQTPVYREAKATTKLLNTAYESDSEFDSSDSDDEKPNIASPKKLRFVDESNQDPNKSFKQDNSNCSSGSKSCGNSNGLNLSSILPNQDEESDDDNDDYESILKHIITQGLMSGLENINRSPHGNKPDKSFSSRPSSKTRKTNTNPTTKKQNENSRPTAEPNINNFPFGFWFGPESSHAYPNTQSNTPTNSGPNTNPTAQEVQLVQKILESLFTPPK